jgi:transposase
LPEHLPRERIFYAAPCTCPKCGGPVRKLGEDVTETLECVPRRWKVVMHVREKVSCRRCEAVSQPPAPSHPIARGRAGPHLLALVLAAKYGQHLPLTRQSAIYAGEGVAIDVSTLADWVGAAAASLMPLVEAIRAHVFAAERIHGDDTTVPVLAKERTRTGRLWVYVATTGRLLARPRRRQRSSTRPTAAGSIPSGTSPASPGSCRPMPMPASIGSTSRVCSRGRSSRLPAGHTPAVSCTS